MTPLCSASPQGSRFYGFLSDDVFDWNVDGGIATLHMGKSLSCRNTREICLLKAKFKLKVYINTEQSFFLPFKIKGLFFHFNEAFSPVGLELLTTRQRQVGFLSTSSSSRLWTLRNVCHVSSVAPLFQLKREAKPVRKHRNNRVFVQVAGWRVLMRRASRSTEVAVVY